MSFLRISIPSACFVLAACSSGEAVVASQPNDTSVKIGAAQITGVVHDRGGFGVPGLKVRAVSTPQRTSDTTFTDSNGEFVFAISRYQITRGEVLPETTEMRIVAESGDVLRASRLQAIVFDSISRPIRQTIVRLIEP